MTTVIQPLPTPPTPADTPTEFNSKAFSTLGALPDFVTQANQLAGEMTILGQETDQDAEAARLHKEAAAGSAGAAAGSAGAARLHKEAAAGSAGAAAGSAGAASTSAAQAASSAVSAANAAKQAAEQAGMAYFLSAIKNTVGEVVYEWHLLTAREEYRTDGVTNIRVLHRNTGRTDVYLYGPSAVAVAVEGHGMVVSGSSGVDSVYVRPGTDVSCTGLGSSRDIIYLPGAWADYTKTLLGSGMAFHRPGTPEYVTVTRGTNNVKDLLVFTDGAVETYAAGLALVADIGVALSTITTYDPLTTTPDEPPASVTPVRGITPADKLLCDGRAVSRALYPALFARIGVLTQVPCTITIANPAVVSGSGLEFTTGVRIRFSTTGELPTGLLPDVDYYVTAISSGTQCTLSATPGGAAIETSGSQSGVHTATTSSYGLGDGTTTFNLPTLGDAGFGIRPFIRF